MKPTVSDRMTRRPGRQPQPAHGRVERGEQLVARRHLGAGQRVEQGRFAGVGVADQRDHRERHPPPRGAVQAAGAPHLLQLLLQPHDAVADQPAVGLDLRLAGAAEEAEAAALPLQVGPGPHQAGALVVQMRQFDLQRAFPGARRARRRCPGSARCGRSPCSSRRVPGCAAAPGDSAASTIATVDARARRSRRPSVATWPSPSSVAGRRTRSGRIAVCTTTRPIEAASPTASASRASAARGRRARRRSRAPVRLAFPGQDDGRAGRRGDRAAVSAVRLCGLQSPWTAGVISRSAPAPADVSALAASNSWIGAPGITVLIACL